LRRSAFNQNVIRVFRLSFLYPTQPVIVKRIVHEAAVKSFQQPQTGFCLQSPEDIPPGDQVFFREEIESLQSCKITYVLLESAIQVCDGSISTWAGVGRGLLVWAHPAKRRFKRNQFRGASAKKGTKWRRAISASLQRPPLFFPWGG
jgi:hypothetical protein